jgi:Holliday junction resolvase-like predicted endonuclease
MASSRHILGTRGEDIAIYYLTRKHYTILSRNVRTKAGEIDLVAMRPDGALAFIEVKTRLSKRHGKPYEAVTQSKLKRLHRAIQLYLLQSKRSHSTLVVEVISISLRNKIEIENIQHFTQVDIPEYWM